MRLTSLAIVTSLTVILAFLTAAVLFASGDTALQRLGILAATIGAIVPGLLGALRADQAATQTNGGLDKRIADAVQAALFVRRHTDAAVVSTPQADTVTAPLEPAIQSPPVD